MQRVERSLLVRACLLSGRQLGAVLASPLPRARPCASPPTLRPPAAAQLCVRTLFAHHDVVVRPPFPHHATVLRPSLAPSCRRRAQTAACLKHFAAYSEETDRNSFAAVVTVQDMEDTYLPAFEVRGGGEGRRSDLARTRRGARARISIASSPLSLESAAWLLPLGA